MASMRERRQVGGLQDVNLVPIMSILVILIPMLLFAFSFFSVTVQSVGAPRLGKTATERGEAPPLTITVVVLRDGFEVKHEERSDGALVETDSVRIGLRAAGSDDADEFTPGHDFAALHNHLTELKTKYPDADQLRLGAAPHVPWRTIARTMDCARVRLNGAPFAGTDAAERFQKATPALARDGAEKLLLPHIVFVVAS